ncbi:MAG: PQQ-binding-like beta-propeller repeat protein [Planctomycetes bacterium]|nr:PQQ-binding-like beta-propeller repeat protein [Planctomycetota bacterium]
MSDDDLRRLERAALAAPDDPEARLALAQALRRAGEEERAVFEVWRAARLGHPVARALLAGGPTPLVTPPRVAEVAAGEDGSSLGWPQAAHGRWLLVMSHEETVLLSLDTRSVTWRVPAEFALLQPGLDGACFVVTHEEGALVRRDGATGEPLARAPLPPGRLTFLDLAEDRLVVAIEDALIGLDAGAALGREVWRRSVEPAARPPEPLASSRRQALAADPGVVVVSWGDGRDRLEALDLETGEARWSAVTTDDADELFVDPHGALLLWRSGRARHLDLGTGAARWESKFSGRRPVTEQLPALTRERVVLKHHAADGAGLQGHVIALDRATGRLAWKRPIPDEVEEYVCLVAAGETVYLVGEAETQFRLAALAAADGRPLWPEVTVNGGRPVSTLAAGRGVVVKADERLFLFETPDAV